MAIQVNLRVSDKLREQLVEAAERRGVSMNKEINDRLERTFAVDHLRSGSGDGALLNELMSAVAGAMNSVGHAAGCRSMLGVCAVPEMAPLVRTTVKA